MVCIVSADHPLAQADHVTTDQCRTLPKIKYQYSPSRQLTTSEDSRKKPIKSDSIFESLYDEGTVLTVSTLESLKRLIAEDAGVTIMPSVIVAGGSLSPQRQDQGAAFFRCADAAALLYPL